MVACQLCECFDNVIHQHFHILSNIVKNIPFQCADLSCKPNISQQLMADLQHNKKEFSQSDISCRIIIIVLAVVSEAGALLCKYRKGTVWMLRGFHLSATFS